MRYLVLSDIHSNLEALEACIARGRREGFDRVLCCGDIVGYGPNPAAVMDIMEDLSFVSIRGNHDRVVAGLGSAAEFNAAARRAIDWTRAALTDSYLQRLAQLPQGPLQIGDNAELVHGSPRDEDEYVVTPQDASVSLSLAPAQITFFGHTHEPGVFSDDKDDKGNKSWVPEYAATGSAQLEIPSGKILVNPGSVGQPRDGDARASFLIWDSTNGNLEFYRVEYDIGAIQDKMRAARLPELLIMRLAMGR